MPISYKLGYIDENTYNNREKVWNRKQKTITELSSKTISVLVEKNGIQKEEKVKAVEYLRRPEVKIDEIINKCELNEIDEELRINIESDVKYQGFIEKQKNEVEKYKSSEKIKIPESFDYDAIPGLLTESRQKLKKIRPVYFGQAMRIPGITPSDINILFIYMSKNNH